MPNANIVHRPRRRRQFVLATAAAAILVTGLGVHRLSHGTLGDIAGDALYAALIYTLIAVLFPRLAASLVAAVAIVFCTAIELFQLSGLPAVWAETLPLSALIFGSGFDQRDLLVYPVGVLAVAVSDALVQRRARLRDKRKTGASPKEDARFD